jgi:hypothetical protein
MGEVRNAYKFLSVNVKGKDHWEILGLDARVILE